MSGLPLPESPYKGLMPYGDEDAAFFFGRDSERQIITANLMSSRLTILYGASRVGKSSVLRAGVAHHVRQLTTQNLESRRSPEFICAVFNSWRDDPIRDLLVRIRDTLERTLPGRNISPLPESGSLKEALQAW